MCHCVCCFSDGYNVNAMLTNTPVNTTASAGTNVTLQCKTDMYRGSAAKIAWLRIDRNPATSIHQIVNFSCKPNRAFPQYSVISIAAGQCDLVIHDVSPALAATYRCADLNYNTADAELTVISKFCVLFMRHTGYCFTMLCEVPAFLTTREAWYIILIMSICKPI